MDASQTTMAFVLVMLFGVAAPILVARMAAPRLARTAPRISNYRGQKVYLGLGIMWAVWMIGAMVADAACILVLGSAPAWLDLVCRAAPLVIGACALGCFDDLVGSRDPAKGFRGHIGALMHGQLTTGMIKMAGIGALSLVAAVASSGAPDLASLRYIALVLTKTAVMALCANEINLFDLRPARALKVYVLGLTLSAVVLACVVATMAAVGTVVAMALLSLVPVVAIWKYDASEQGLMGDAGSNAMGAFLGYFICTTMPLPGLAVVALVLLALNLLSERVSYSALIARVPFLTWLDNLGRPHGIAAADEKLAPQKRTGHRKHMP